MTLSKSTASYSGSASPIADANRILVGRTSHDLQIDEFTVFVPASLKPSPRVLLALPGMGGTGKEFAEAFRPNAERHGWVLAVPTFEYGDWRSPSRLTDEAHRQLPRVAEFLDQLPEAIGLPLQPRVVIYGFSRGGQTAHRFALAYPERVAGVAVASAGTFTVPSARASEAGSLTFPYGIADLQEVTGRRFDPEEFASIRFWIGVGDRDSDPSELPREWDPYIGSNRVERATRFADWVREAGAAAQVHVLPGLGHGETDEERVQALAFLASLP